MVANAIRRCLLLSEAFHREIAEVAEQHCEARNEQKSSFVDLEQLQPWNGCFENQFQLRSDARSSSPS